MKFFNRIKSAFYALTHDTTTISLLDERFWTQYGSIRNSKLSEVTYFTCLKTLSEAPRRMRNAARFLYGWRFAGAHDFDARR